MYAFLFTQLSELNSFQIQSAQRRQAAYLARYRTASPVPQGQGGGEAGGVLEGREQETGPTIDARDEGTILQANAGQLPLMDAAGVLPGPGPGPGIVATPSLPGATGQSEGKGQDKARVEHLEEGEEGGMDDLLRAMDQRIGAVIEALAPNSLLLVVTGGGDTAECRRMQELKVRPFLRFLAR